MSVEPLEIERDELQRGRAELPGEGAPAGERDRSGGGSSQPPPRDRDPRGRRRPDRPPMSFWVKLAFAGLALVFFASVLGFLRTRKEIDDGR